MENGSNNSLQEHESEVPNLSIMDTAFDSIWVVDHNYCLKYGNLEFFRNFKLLTGKTIRNGDSVFPPTLSKELRRKWKTCYDMVLNTGESCSVELESLVSQPDTFTQYSFSPVYANAGKALGVLVIGRVISLKKQAEEALKKSEQNARSLIDAIPDMIFRLDTSGTFIDYKAERKDLHLHPENFIGKNVEVVMPKWFSKLIMAKITLAMKRNDVEVFEYELPNLQNELLQFECRLLPVPNNEIIAIVRNVTDRKRIEKRLIESETRARTIMESTTDSLFLIDKTGTILDFNEAFVKMFGLSQKDYRGMHIESILPNKITRQYRHLISQVLNIATPYHGEDYINGVWSEFSIYPVAAKSGLSDSLVIFVKDITKRKKAEDSLKKSENKYRYLHESMRDGFVHTDMQGRICEFNHPYQKMLGYEREGLLKMTYFDLTPEKWHDFENRIVEEQIMRRGYSDIYVKEYIKKNGEVIPVEFRTVLIKDENGENTGMWAIVRDISERMATEKALKESEKRLREMNAAKDKYFSILAHDLKNPFHSIIGFSEILKNDARNIDIGAIENFASIINDSATQTLRLLENLLDWARMQQDNISFALKNLVLAETYKEVANLMDDLASRKNIELHNQIPDHIIVKADENMLKAIFRNLISNAIKFTKSGGSVKIAAQTMENEIMVSVSDNGIGISNINMKKLFCIDSNFSMRGTGQEKGTGLGLLLCKEFVEKHGGRIWVESEEGKGSKFIFTIPVKR